MVELPVESPSAPSAVESSDSVTEKVEPSPSQPRPRSRARPGQVATQEPTEETRSSASPGNEVQVAAPDSAPRLRTLIPDGARLLGMLDPSAPALAPEDRRGSGRTVYNTGEPDEATRRAQAEAAAAEAGSLVEGWSRDVIAEVRVRDGAVDDYFRVLGDELERRAQVERPLEVKLKEGVQSIVAGYFKDLGTYGATGSPTRPAGLGDLDEHFDVADPKGMHQTSAEMADQYARVQEYLQRFGAELVIIVELDQDALGRVVAVRVLKASGDRLFDQHIVKVAHAGEFPGVPDHVAARSPAGIRTTWEFRGRYNFKKKLRELDVKNPADAAYLAAMGVGSLLAGGAFEESTLDVYILDVRDPRFEVRSKLLRLY